MIKEILINNKLVGLIIRSSYKSEGINFFTPNDFSPKNYVIAPHLHNYVPRNISFTKEVLFIKSGTVRVDFYGDDKNYLESYILYAGDVILLAYGGHGFKMLEPTEMIEVKQGPYVADQDKNRFEAVNDEKLKIKY